MRTLFRLGIVVAVAGVIFVAVIALWAYRASQHVPEFYERALQADPQVQVQASDELVQQAIDLTSDVRESGSWEALFTAQQINGWLAVDLTRNHSKLLPPTISEPRVAIDPQGIQLGCRYQDDRVSTVCSMRLEPSLAEDNVLALRIRNAKAGDLPLPLSRILESITQAAERSDLRLKWRKEGDDPVALITIPSPRTSGNLEIHVTRMELREGAIYVAGESLTHGQPAETDKPELGKSATNKNSHR